MSRTIADRLFLCQAESRLSTRGARQKLEGRAFRNRHKESAATHVVHMLRALAEAVAADAAKNMI